MEEVVQNQEISEDIRKNLSSVGLRSKQKEEIKTIVFDLGGVIFTAGSILAIDKVCKFFNICNVEKVKRIFGNKHGSLGNLIRRGIITFEDFENRVAEELQIPEEKKHFLRHFWFGSYVPNYKMMEVVKKLSKSYRLVIFSGNVRKRIEYLDQHYDFLKYFKDFVFSFDYQINKRDMKIYEELLNHIKCEPEEAVLIDDCVSNLDRAATFGLNGIQYIYSEQFFNDLKSFNIELEN